MDVGFRSLTSLPMSIRRDGGGKPPRVSSLTEHRSRRHFGALSVDRSKDFSVKQRLFMMRPVAATCSLGKTFITCFITQCAAAELARAKQKQCSGPSGRLDLAGRI